MSQHDYIIDNGGGAAVRADINSVLQAIQSQNSGSSAPTVTKPYMPWYDTTNGVLKFRNASDTGWISGLEAVAGPVSVGYRNRIINGAMQVDQRNAGASQTFTAAAALAYAVDRWYGYCTGANVTGQRVTISGLNRYRFTGAASNTGVGLGQRIEAANSADLAGSTAVLSIKAFSTSLTSIGWALYYANSTDSFGTLASPTRTLISSGTISIGTIEATYSTSPISIPSGATTGLELVITGGALLASQTLTIGDFQLEAGPIATPIERRPYSAELALCQRYFQKLAGFMPGGVENTTVASFGVSLLSTMRAAPTFTATATTADIRISGSTTGGIAGTWSANALGADMCGFMFTRSSGTWTANIPAFLNQTTSIGTLSAEL